MPKRVYISGAITGTSDYIEKFAKAEAELIEKGYSVINPAKNGDVLPKDATWDEYMSISICEIDMCQSMYMIDGWEKSCGSNREYGYALAKGMEIMFE